MKSFKALYLFYSFLCVALLSGIAQANLPSAKRIVFLGDSITQDGRYLNYLETVLLLETQKEYDILNLGLSSETVSGLTEASSAKHRPVLFSRLNSAISITRPGLVFLCYGMNDGIYHPFSEGRFDRFATGIEKARANISRYGAGIVHMTPPMFDALPIQSKLAPKDAKDFGYSSPSRYYDRALEIYSDRMNIQRRGFGWRVIDIHEAMKSSVLQKRKSDPSFTYAPDGVHPNDEGHWLMARQILKYWGVSTKVTLEDLTPPNGKYAQLAELVKTRQNLIRAAYMNETAGIKLPKLEILKISEARARAAEITEQIQKAKAGESVVLPIPAVKAPEAPKPAAPAVKAPEAPKPAAPAVKAPEAPKPAAPAVKTPEAPKPAAPAAKALEAQKPAAPAVKAPEAQKPAAPAAKAPEAPKPTAPAAKAPEAPKPSLRDPEDFPEPVKSPAAGTPAPMFRSPEETPLFRSPDEEFVPAP